jgi:hypothetical protein
MLESRDLAAGPVSDVPECLSCVLTVYTVCPDCLTVRYKLYVLTTYLPYPDRMSWLYTYHILTVRCKCTPRMHLGCCCSPVPSVPCCPRLVPLSLCPSVPLSLCPSVPLFLCSLLFPPVPSCSPPVPARGSPVPPNRTRLSISNTSPSDVASEWVGWAACGPGGGCWGEGWR